MSRIKYSYTLLDRQSGKTLNIHKSREDARSEAREWREVDVKVDIVQSKYVHIIDRVVR